MFRETFEFLCLSISIYKAILVQVPQGFENNSSKNKIAWSFPFFEATKEKQKISLHNNQGRFLKKSSNPLTTVRYQNFELTYIISTFKFIIHSIL